MEQLEMWTLLPGDSPVRTSVTRTPVPRGSMVQGVDSSSRCSESSARLDRLGLSLRTHLRCALEAQTGYSMSWKDRATPAGRSWWVLGMSSHPTDETASGLLPTPNTPNGGRRVSKNAEWKGTTAYLDGKKQQVGLETALLGHLPTPATRDYKDCGAPEEMRRKSPQTSQLLLAEKLPTPTALEYGSNQGGAAGRVGEKRPSLRLMLTPTAKANLNSASMDKWAGARALREMMESLGVGGTVALAHIYEWMMGYPRGWLDSGSKPTETP